MGVEQGVARWRIELQGERGVLEGPSDARVEAIVELGALVSVGLSLSSGEWVRFDARVRSVDRKARGRVEVRVEFTELSVAERQAFHRWQRLLARRDGSTCLPATVEAARIIDAPSSWTRSWRA